eukprot:Selendium_serpulae@DN5550_c0_g1_i1.p1
MIFQLDTEVEDGVRKNCAPPAATGVNFVSASTDGIPTPLWTELSVSELTVSERSELTGPLWAAVLFGEEATAREDGPGLPIIGGGVFLRADCALPMYSALI